ncbi:hypothetical protein WA1_11190 [Scytonema hofmannii PCC 7110]|uniref:histidine kinase n=1 Tax=Scytonema hofmannii PCC 7110 TaxID=128403 RepID=A0A139XFC8_9CYAN|nr:hypothetical protein [Scytonema hofmannii]KYC43397.1 hypothetical protein WA1_11190 [Scytonema hofmannii PCC 7110]
MNNKIIHPTTYINSDWVYQEFKQFASSLSIELRLSLNSILAWAHLWRQGRMDYSTTVQAFEDIEQNVICQSLLIEQLLEWRLTSDKLEGVDCKPIIVDAVNQQFERDQSSLAREFKFYLDRTLNLTHLWHQSQFSQSTTIEAFEAIEQNAKRQSRILEKLLNWHFNPYELK